MNLNNLCMGCMKEKNSQDGKCPYCGFDNTKENNKPDQLPIWHILNGEYLVGKSLAEDDFGVTYLGFDLNKEKKVAIKMFSEDCKEKFGEEYRVFAQPEKETNPPKGNSTHVIMVIIAAVAVVGLLIVGAVGAISNKINNSQNTLVSALNEANSEQEAGVSVEELNGYRDNLYELLYSRNSDYEAIATDICNYAVGLREATEDSFNDKVTEYADMARLNAGYSQTGWLVLPYDEDVTYDVIVKDIINMIDEQNAQSGYSQFPVGEVGISIGVRVDGMLMVAVVYY